MSSFFSNCLVLLLLSSFLSCGNEDKNREASKDSDSIVTEPISLYENSKLDDSAQVHLSINKLENSMIELQLNMNLFGDTWIVSPLEKDFPYGGMRIEVMENNYLELIDSIIENPKSKYKTDEYVENPYRIITNETELFQKFRLKSDQDFVIPGLVFYVLEPICTANEIHFQIVKNGQALTIERLEVGIIPA